MQPNQNPTKMKNQKANPKMLDAFLNAIQNQTELQTWGISVDSPTYHHIAQNLLNNTLYLTGYHTLHDNTNYLQVEAITPQEAEAAGLSFLPIQYNNQIHYIALDL